MEAIKNFVRLNKRCVLFNDRLGNTALVWAAYLGHKHAVQELIAQGARADAVTRSGYTPLMLAAHAGHADIVEELIFAVASPDMRDPEGSTALMRAAKNGHTEIVQVLEANGAVVDAVNAAGNSAIVWAASEGHLDTVKVLRELGADAERRNGDGDTPIMWAARNGHDSIVKYLLSTIHPDVNEANDRGDTLFLLASEQGSLDTLNMLREGGADTQVINNDGNGGLILAAMNGHVDTVAEFVEWCKPQVPRDYDKPWATRNKAARVNANADDEDALPPGPPKNVRNYTTGHTALMVAAENGQHEMVELLLADDADVNLRNRVRVACSEASLACLRMLQPGHLTVLVLFVCPAHSLPRLASLP